MEFALKWRINPEEVRRNWSLRDMRWLSLVEEAQRLAAPQIERSAADKAARRAKAKREK